jgi:hypothetical protein
MLTQDGFLALFEGRPEMKHAFDAAVVAVVELRRVAAKNKTACWLSLN